MRDALKFAGNYLGAKEYPFPSEDIDMALRDGPDYYRAAGNAIMSKYVNNKCAVPYNVWGTRRPFWELRAYRKGQNSPNKYKDLLIGCDERGNRLKTTMSISWDILQILPQKIDVVKGYLQKINYDFDIQAIDYQSLIDKKTMVSMAKVLADPHIDDMRKQVSEAAGRSVLQDVDPSKAPGGTIFASPEQVDVAAQVGVFFLEEEAAMQNLLDTTQYESGSEGISDLVKEDLITLAESGKRVYTNPNTNIVVEDWVDVDRAIYPWSEYTDYRDISYAGQVKRYSIARLLQETAITEAEAIKIARSYSTNNGVSDVSNVYSDIARYRQTGQFGMNMWHQIEVDVLDCVWFGKKNVNVTSVKRKDGTIHINKVSDTYNLSSVANNKGKQLDKHTYQTVYKCKMVVGTSFLFDYGEDNDISYNTDMNGNKNPILPYRFVRTGSSSLVERCIGFVDDANLTNYKLRVARMKMPAPPNLFIDKSVLENVQIDGVRHKPMGLIKLLSDEGFLIGDSKNQWGTQTNQGKAVSPIGSDLMQVIVGWWEDMARSIEMIEKVTGINDVFAAQTPQRQTGLGVSNLMIQGAQNALTPIIKANEYITEQPWRIAAKKWQIVATYLPEDQKKKLSINRSLQIVKIGSKMADRDFDLKIQAGNTDEEIAQLLVDLQNMKSAARQGGQQSLTESDYLVVYELLKSRKLKQAQLYTAFAIEKQQEKQQEQAQAAIQDNAGVQQESAQQKGAIDAQNIQVKGQVDGQNEAQIQAMKSRNDIQLAIIQGQQRQAEIRLQAALTPRQQSA